MGKSSRSRKKGKKHNNYNNVSSNSNGSSSANQEANYEESDIPGYYYDKEKKKYFKILPNNMSSVSSFVTKETIKKKRDENRRLEDRNNVLAANEKLPSSTSASIATQPEFKKVKAGISVTPLLDVLVSMQCGQHTCRSLQRRMMQHRCKQLRPQPGWEAGLDATFASSYGSVEGIQRMEVSKDSDKAVTVWSVKGTMIQWMQLITIKTRKKLSSTSGTHLNLVICNSGFEGTPSSKVTSLCWSPLSREPGKACVLYTTVCPFLYNGSQASIFSLEEFSRDQAHKFSFDLGKHSVWSCAWNQHNSRFSVGCEKKCHVIDVHTRCKWTYSAQNSDCLSQLFSVTNPHLLYTGTRNGYMITLDLRAPPFHQEVVKFNHKSPVVCLRTLKDENYIMASDYSGLIRTWDTRFRKTVLTYRGLENSHYQIPFYINDTERFIYATGSNGYTKIWDIMDGVLIKSIAPPLSLQPGESFPVSHLSGGWGGVHGNFGLVTAMENRLFLYS